MQEVIIKIKSDGSVTVEGEGFQGQGCIATTLAYYKELGEAKHMQLKGEYYQENQTHQKTCS